VLSYRHVHPAAGQARRRVGPRQRGGGHAALRHVLRRGHPARSHLHPQPDQVMNSPTTLIALLLQNLDAANAAIQKYILERYPEGSQLSLQYLGVTHRVEVEQNPVHLSDPGTVHVRNIDTGKRSFINLADHAAKQEVTLLWHPNENTPAQP